MKYCFCVFLASAVLIAAQEAKDDYGGLGDYDDFYDYDQLKEEGDKLEVELDKLDAESDLKVKSEIDKFREENLELVEGGENADYQIEDNRDKPKEDKKEISADIDGSLVAGDLFDAPMNNDDVKDKHDDQADYALLWGDDSVAPLPVPDAELAFEDKDIIDKKQQLLKNDTDAFEEEIIKAIANAETFSNNKPSEEIIDETKKILEETDDAFNDNEVINTDGKLDETKKVLKENDDLLNSADDKLDNESLVENELNSAIKDDIPIEKAVKDVPIENMAVEVNGQDIRSSVEQNKNSSSIEQHKVIVEEDTVDKVYADLNEDLDKLFETLDKLSDNGSDGDEKLEEVFDKLDDHFLKEDDNNIEGSEESVDDVKENDEYSDVDFDKILEDILNENDIKLDDSPSNIDLNVQLNDEMNEPNPDDAFERDIEPLPEVDAEPILYLDAIVDEPKTAESLENINNNNTAVIDASVEVKELNPEKPTNKVSVSKKTDTVDIDTLNSEELEDLVKQFSIAHNDVLDVQSETFDRNVAPIHIKLNVDNPEVVTSPNYPSAYPTNNIVDWIFEGEGMGIEMNITDFVLNGALGDYLLVKPGGIDESGHDGLLFTYRLNSEKRFRFMDVDRLFVRFESKRGLLNLMRGFRFTVKMIAPIPEELEPIPEPEPVADPPHSHYTVHLAIAIPQFNETSFKETFRLLLADMAAEYIADNHIEPGLNTTAEITQITSVSVCPVTWPNFELCTAVTFGVSLVYLEDGDEILNEEALQDMWRTYSTRDPYALRLRQMGITEFQQPSSTVLTAWLVIASGVVISMVMLAFVLWRFSCFEDYSRMKTYSDTDSLHNEKRGLDLYPTPHQTLPPLYAENEYKWTENEDTTRVDMGGFANKSYARDMYDFDSDEEVITPRDVRSGAVAASDIYNGSVA